MKTGLKKLSKTNDMSKKIAPNKGIGRLSDNPKLKELLEKYGNHENVKENKNRDNN